MNHARTAKSSRAVASHAKPGRNQAAGSLRTRYRQQWNALKKSAPGHRFQERYERNREDGNLTGRIARTLLGGALVIAGLTLMVIPGPGLPVLVVGAGLLATDSKPAAKLLDWVELKIRPVSVPVTCWLAKHWLPLPRSARIAIALCTTATSMTAAYFLRTLFSGGS